MTSLVLEPHNDDAALFCSFTAQRERAHIVTCLRSFRQESLPCPITFGVREAESEVAAAELGCTWGQWAIPDNLPADKMSAALRPMMARLLADDHGWDHVYAPQPLSGGHEHHTLVGTLASDYVDFDRLTFYTTYRRGEGRTVGAQVPVEDPAWIAGKLRALACFGSQHAEPTTQPWFLNELTEFYA